MGHKYCNAKDCALCNRRPNQFDLVEALYEEPIDHNKIVDMLDHVLEEEFERGRNFGALKAYTEMLSYR